MKKSRRVFAAIAAAPMIGVSPSFDHPAPAATAISATPSMRIASTFAPLEYNRLSRSSSESAESSADCYSLPRATTDRPDHERGPSVHVIYLVPADGQDNALDTNGVLDCSARAQNQWIAEQADGLEWRFDTFVTQVEVAGRTRTVAALDVTYIKSTRLAKDLYGAGGVSRELELLGFADDNTRYLTYVEAGGGQGGICGDAYYPLPLLDRPWSGQYSQVYLRSHPNCGSARFGLPGAPSFSESVAQQELMHNDGMTPIGAPHSCAYAFPPLFAHVCTGALPVTEGSLNLDPERYDVMFPYAGVPLSQKVLDRDHDDYFKHSLPIPGLENSPFLRPVSQRPVVNEPPRPEPSASASADRSRSITLNSNRDSVRRGGRVRLFGAMSGASDCVAGQDVLLQARPPAGGSFRSRASQTTDESGAYAFTPRLKESRVFRVIAPGPDCEEAISPEVFVRVRA